MALMVNNFLMWGGFFMVIPLITVHFGSGLGWSALSVGAVLGTRQLTQQGLTVFGGALSDRTGPRPLIALGLLTRALGFAAMGLSTSFPALLASGILAGVGGGLFDAPKNAAVTALSTPDNRVRVFSLMSMAGNLGMVTGPLIGAAALGLRFPHGGADLGLRVPGGAGRSCCWRCRGFPVPRRPAAGWAVCAP